MQEAGSTTKNREDKYQFDNVERERAGGGKARCKKKKKNIPYAARTAAALGKTERNASGGEKTRVREARGRKKEKENEITRSYLICRR